MSLYRLPPHADVGSLIVCGDMARPLTCPGRGGEGRVQAMSRRSVDGDSSATEHASVSVLVRRGYLGHQPGAGVRVV